MGFHGYISINNDFRIIFQEAEVLHLYMDKQIRIAENTKQSLAKVLITLLNMSKKIAIKTVLQYILIGQFFSLIEI